MISGLFWGPLSRFGFSLAAIVLLADQLSKWWLVFQYRLPERGTVQLTSFFDLVMVWNKGISYGLFPQDSIYGTIGLILFALIAVALLAIWLAKSERRLVATGLGLVIGGAIGNAIDRALYGAVADFFSFHAFGFYWYVFNIADIAIVAGVIGLLYDSFFDSKKNDRTKVSNPP